MRVFILMLIMVTSFGGYSAAAHAFADEICSPSISQHMHDQPDAHQDCTNHAGANSDSDGVCMDCHHCCASHTIISNAKTPDTLLWLIAEFIPAGSHLKDEYLFSFLRPPKTLV